MAVFGTTVLTQQGQALYAKVQAGATLEFTRMQIGSGQLGVGQDPATLTALITPIAYFAVNSMVAIGNTATIRGLFENSSVNAPTYACELGLFANDPDLGEILYIYCNAADQGDNIPAISSGPWSMQYEIDASTGNASNVTVNVPADSYIPVTEKGAAGGVATLDGGTTIPDAQIPASIARESELTAHTSATTGIHGATSAATASKIVQRDAAGRAQFADPSADADAATKGYADGRFKSLSTAGTLDWNDASNLLDGVGPTLLRGDAANGPGSTGYFHSFCIWFTNTNVTQFAIPYSYQMGSVTTQCMYMRGRYNNVWGPWIKLYDTMNLPNPAKTDAANIFNQTQTVQRDSPRFSLDRPSGGANDYAGFDAKNNGTTVSQLLYKYSTDNWGIYDGGFYPMWHHGDLRWNVDHLEYNDGGTWKAVGGVKNVQRGVTVVGGSATSNVTISSVDPSKSYVILHNVDTDSNNKVSAYAQLTSATNLQIVNGGVTGRSISWEVIESY